MELHRFAQLMIEGKPVVSHTEEPKIEVNDALIGEAIEVFKDFVYEVGTKHNGSKDG